MKINIEVPIILEEQQKIIDWSRKLRSKYIDISSVIEHLVSDKMTCSDYINDGLEEVRKIYQSKNGYWRTSLLTALMVENYRFENDFKDGNIVTNGKFIGFAYHINYQDRVFNLFSSTEPNASTIIDTFDMDDFKKVRDRA